MGNLKDKLTNSVRQASTAANPAQGQSRAAGRARPAPAAAALPAAAIPTADRSSAGTQTPAPSAKEIFPRRVWPD